MAKTVLMVQKADGTKERICPKCNNVMQFHEGGYSERFELGEYTQVDYPDQWECMTCGLIIDDLVEADLMHAFGLA